MLILFCNSFKMEQQREELNIRVHNLGQTDFKEVQLISPDSTYTFTNIPSKNKSEYKSFEKFQITDWNIQVVFKNGENINMDTKHVGQQLITKGNFRISIIASPDKPNPDTIYLISE